MEKRTKKIICFSICFLILSSNYLCAKAEALPDVMSGSSTLADNIMTYYALSGSAVANTDWINTLYSSYGSSFGTIEELANQGYLVLNDAGMWEPVQQLGEMIEEAPAYASLGLNEMFNISAEEAIQGGGLAAASGASVLAGSLGGVASTGVVPLLGGVTAAYWGGIALGTLVAHGLGLYSESVYQGTPIIYRDISNNIPSGSKLARAYRTYNNIKYTGFVYGNGVPFSYQDQSTVYYGIANISDNNIDTYRFEINMQSSALLNARSTSIKSGNTILVGVVKTQTPYGVYTPNNFPNKAAFDSALKDWMDGTSEPNYPKSPDLIGENGNLDGQYNQNTGEYTVPDYKPQIDPGTQAGKPLTLEDWLQFANAVNNNNNNSNPIGNKDLFDDIMDALKVGNPNAPDPNPDPDPWSPPVITPVPDPTYPDPVPDQQITENPQESENPQQTEPLDPTDTGKPWRLPDLREKFPFCIPWDIANVFTKLKVNVRQAPHISWRFNPPNTPIDYTFNLDLEDFESVASLLRTLELMGFIVGLAFVTRYLIGAN